MKSVNLDEWVAYLERRKQELGMRDTPETTEAMRNKGEGRTPEKRELLSRMAQRARDAGKTPVKAYH